MRLTLYDVEDFARGAAVLGAGGGGDPYIGQLALKHKLKTRHGGGVDVLELDDLADDAFVVPFAMFGSPTVMIERLMAEDAGTRVIRRLERHVGRKADALISGEIGGINALFPLVAAAELGLPVLNADGIGRAFPKLEMCTFGIYGGKASPTVLIDDHGDCVIIESEDNAKTEVFARHVCVGMGFQATTATYPMTGAQAKRTAVPRTLELALDIGRTISRARGAHEDPFAALADFFKRRQDGRICKVLFDGKIADLDRRTERGWALGVVTLEPIGAQQGRMTIDFQNENLIARIDGAPVAMTPDLITILDRETAEPITTENLKYGQRVKVIGIAAPSPLTNPEAIAVCGPRAFGYDLDFAPLMA